MPALARAGGAQRVEPIQLVGGAASAVEVLVLRAAPIERPLPELAQVGGDIGSRTVSAMSVSQLLLLAYMSRTLLLLLSMLSVLCKGEFAMIPHVVLLKPKAELQRARSRLRSTMCRHFRRPFLGLSVLKLESTSVPPIK